MIDITKFEDHTAGPWAFNYESAYIGCQEGMVALLCPDAARSYDQFDANARLIAAAPDLLAEVIRLRAALTAVCADVIDPVTQEPSAVNARLIAAAADLMGALGDPDYMRGSLSCRHVDTRSTKPRKAKEKA